VRTAFLGTSEFAVTVLRRLSDSDHRPELIVAPPHRRSGRGRRLRPPPVAEAARELNLELLQAESVNDDEVTDRIESVAPQAIAVCAFGQLIKDPLLSAYPMLNVHPSLLPRWRGAAPIERAIMAGDQRTGVTVMRVGEGLDSGPIALQEEIEIGPGEDFASLSRRLADLGGRLLLEALDRLAAGKLEFSEQDESGATYAEKIDPAERRLDPARPATELERAVRALGSHVGTHLELEDGGWLGVRAAAAIENGIEAGRVEVVDDSLVLGCAVGALRLELVQPSGKRAMTAGEFLRGHEPPSRAT
jgi:methionyl-tRNA formyltransferase